MVLWKILGMLSGSFLQYKILARYVFLHNKILAEYDFLQNKIFNWKDLVLAPSVLEA